MEVQVPVVQEYVVSYLNFLELSPTLQHLYRVYNAVCVLDMCVCCCEYVNYFILLDAMLLPFVCTKQPIRSLLCFQQPITGLVTFQEPISELVCPMNFRAKADCLPVLAEKCSQCWS